MSDVKKGEETDMKKREETGQDRGHARGSEDRREESGIKDPGRIE